MRLFISLVMLSGSYVSAHADMVNVDQMIAQMNAPVPAVKTPVKPTIAPAPTQASPVTKNAPTAPINPSTPAPALVQPPAASAGNEAAALNMGVGLGIGTTGIGGYVSLPIAPQRLNARFGINYFRYSYNGQADNIAFNFKLILNSYDALIDWFPFGGDFRLTTGIVYNANKVEASGKPSIAGKYVVNGRTYNADDIGYLKGKIAFPTFVPYLGFGYGNTVDTAKRWTIFSDTGILLNSSPSARVHPTGCNAPGPVCEALDRDLDALNVSLRDNFRFFKVYPIMRIGIAYRF